MYMYILTYIHVDIIITDLRPMTLVLALFSAMLSGGHCSRHQRRRSKVSGSRSDDGGGGGKGVIPLRHHSWEDTAYQHVPCPYRWNYS